MADWKRIKMEYIKGGKEVTYESLAEKHGVSLDALKKHGTREKWREMRHKKEEAAAQKVIERLGSAEAAEMCNLKCAAELLIEQIVIAAKAGAIAPQNIKSLTSALRDLGYRTDKEQEEQDARIAKLRKEAQQMSGDEDDDNTGVLMLPEADAPLIDKEESRE